MSNLPYGSQSKDGHSPAHTVTDETEALPSSPLLPGQHDDQGRTDHHQHQKQHQPGTIRQWLASYYERNFGLFLVFLAQIFGSIVSTCHQMFSSQRACKVYCEQNEHYESMTVIPVYGWLEQANTSMLHQMSTTTRLLETGFETKFHALQVIFVRMITTAVIGSLYLWYKQVPGFPLGPRGVRWLLVLRGLAGSSGLFGLYCMSANHLSK